MERMQKYPEYDGTQHCASWNTELFYDEPRAINDKRYNDTLTMLRAVCVDCPFYNECLVWSLHHEKYGFWAGLTRKERDDIRKKKNIKFLDPVTNVYDSLYSFRRGLNKYVSAN